MFTLKKHGYLSACLINMIHPSGRVSEVEVGSDLANFVNRHEKIEVSKTPFAGSKAINAEPSKGYGWYFLLDNDRKIWACTEGLNRRGFAMSKLKKIYIKTYKKGE